MIGEQIIDDVMKSRIEQLENLVDIQCSDGNWNYDAYMHGMGNGMILSLDLIKGKTEPSNFLEAPEKWLKDK